MKKSKSVRPSCSVCMGPLLIENLFGDVYLSNLSWLCYKMRGLVATWYIAKNGKPVPGIDSHDRQHQLHQLFIAELLPRFIVDLIRYPSLSNECGGFGKSQRGALSTRVIRCFAPDAKAV